MTLIGFIRDPLVFSFQFNCRCGREDICMFSILFLFEKKKLQNLLTAKNFVFNLASAKLPICTLYNKVCKVNIGQISYAVIAIFSLKICLSAFSLNICQENEAVQSSMRIVCSLRKAATIHMQFLDRRLLDLSQPSSSKMYCV